MLRFLLLAVPLALLVLAVVAAGATALGLAPARAPLAARGVARPAGLGAGLLATAWLYEAVALVALFVLVEGRLGSPALEGLAAGVAAWLFHGPLLVVTVASLTRLPTAPFWDVARQSLVAFTLAGLAVGLVARTRPGRA